MTTAPTSAIVTNVQYFSWAKMSQQARAESVQCAVLVHSLEANRAILMFQRCPGILFSAELRYG